MKRILFHGLSWGWLLTAIFLVLLAITISVLRAFAPMGSQYRSEIEQQISAIVKRPVEIQDINFELQGFKPVVSIQGLTVLSREEKKPVLSFEHMMIALNPWESLHKRKLVPSQVVLAGSELKINRQSDGQITLSGFRLGTGGTEVPAEQLDILTDLTFQLKDITVYWGDEPLGISYKISTQEMNVKITRHSLAVQGDILLPEDLGDQISVALDIRGPVNNYLDWDGDFFVYGRRLSLPLLPLEVAAKFPAVEQGDVALRVWGNWHGQKLKQATGSLAFKDLLFRATQVQDKKVPPLFRLDNLNTWFNLYAIEQGWQIDADRLKLTTAEKRWPKSGFSLAWQQNGQNQLLRGVLQYLDIATLTPAIKVFTQPNDKLTEIIDTTNPQGEIQNLRFSWRPGVGKSPVSYAASGEFSNISWLPWEKAPGLENLDGTFDLDQDDGQVLLSSFGLSVNYPKLFTDIIWVDSLDSQIEWKQNDNDSWEVSANNLHLVNEDLQISGDVSLQFADGKDFPKMQLAVAFPGLPMEKVRNYLPQNILPEKTGNWLQKAFVAGRASNGKFSYDGPLRSWAFKDGTAKMLASINVEDATLAYQNGWPQATGIKAVVKFANASFSINASKGQIFENHLRQGKAAIKSFYRPELNLDLNLKGTLPAGLQYLRNIPPGHAVKDLLDASKSAGPIDLKLDIDVPLTSKLGKKTTVKGVLDFQNNSLALPEHEVEINNLKGRLEFTENSYTASKLQGVFREAAVDINVATKPDQAVDIKFSGLLPVNKLLPGNKLLPKIAHGESLWHGTVKVPSKQMRAKNKPLQLHLISDLKGTKISLPAPLGKISLVQRDFMLDLPLGQKKTTLRFSYDPVLFGMIELKGKSQKQEINRASISLSEQDLKLPVEGIDIIGHWPIMHTGLWQKRFEEIANESEKSSIAKKIKRIHVSFSEWLLASQQFSNVQLTAAKNAQYWRANIKSDGLTGFLRIPLKQSSSKIFEADLQKLYLKKTTASGSPTSPRDLPALKIKSEDFRWQGESLGQLELNTEKDLWGQQIKLLQLKSDDLVANFSGQWRQDDQGRQHTKLDFDIQGKNLGNTLNKLDISSTLDGGEGSLKGVMRWDDAPYKLALSTWNGELDVSVKNGRLNQVNPGFGRVLGLLNLDQLPKRLALQFSDVSGKGFEFSELGGHVALVDGAAYFQQFKIESASANMNLSGSADLGSRQYNLELGVIPNISSTVPLAAGLIAGPQVGAVAYLVDKLASGVGVDINKAVEQHYRITGSWDEPIVKSLNFEDDTGPGDADDEEPFITE